MKLSRKVLHRQRWAALATVLVLMFAVSACTSDDGDADSTSASTTSDATVDVPEVKSPEQVGQEIEAQIAVVEPEIVVPGKIKSGPRLFGAELAVLGVEASENTTRLVVAMRSTSGKEETVDYKAFNDVRPLNPGIRDLSIIDLTAERVLRPYLALHDEADPGNNTCLCSHSPKSLNDTWFTLYATMPNLDPATTTVTVDVPGFPSVTDVPVTRD